MEFAVLWAIMLGLGCVQAASAIYTLATNRLPWLALGKRWIKESRHYGFGQLFIGFFGVFLALSNMVMGWSHALSLALIFLALGCLLAGSFFESTT